MTYIMLRYLEGIVVSFDCQANCSKKHQVNELMSALILTLKPFGHVCEADWEV